MAKRKPEKMKKPDEGIAVGKSRTEHALSLKFANRHGLVAGATGTGKTVTLQVLAEGFSRAGVPVFAADIKGDLAGIAMPGEVRYGNVSKASGGAIQRRLLVLENQGAEKFFGEAGPFVRGALGGILRR